jgi:5'-3' exonuclease
MISNLMAQIGNHTNAQVEETMLRHMVLNSIRSIKTKFSHEYGEVVIACDNKNCWRRAIFPYYKANRKKNRDSSELNWTEIFGCLDKIRQELKDYFPYKVIDMETSEADDIIATLVFNYGLPIDNGDKILILSGDKDFIQLHRFANVYQYDPVRKKFLQHNDPKTFLKEHIMKGDSGDGVPNFLSNDDCFVIGERQKPLTAKKMEQYMQTDPQDFDERLKRNYYRNAQMIDLTYIPVDLQEKIMIQFNSYEVNKKNKLLNYFINNRLKMLMEHISEF